MSAKPAYTHTVRPKSSSAKPEHVTDAQLATMRESFGERTMAKLYEVTPLAEKPADLPTTTTEAPKAETAEKKK